MEGFNQLLAATVLFVGGHFLLSDRPLRGELIHRIGDKAFRLVYSASAVGAFVWLGISYGKAPTVVLWTAPAALYWVPLLVMPVAFILAVAGLTTRSPTAMGGEVLLDGSQNPAPGILRVTRHPFLWAVALWAASHILVNGYLASLIMMGGLLILSLGGMRHIDRRREDGLGSAWGPMKLTTSALPFAALASRRTSMDWKGLGWWRPALGLAAYIVFLGGHLHIFGVSPFPAGFG